VKSLNPQATTPEAVTPPIKACTTSFYFYCCEVFHMHDFKKGNKRHFNSLHQYFVKVSLTL